MQSLLIPSVTFIAVVVAIIGAYWTVVVLPESKQRSSLQQRLKSDDSTLARVRLLKTPDALSSIGVLDTVLIRLSFLSTPLKRAVDASGLQLSVGTFVLLVTTCFFAATLAGQVYTRIWWLALIGGAFAALIPFWVLSFMKKRQLTKFEQQFPEAIELIARAMRAGHAFATGIRMAAEELPAPAGPEFKLLYERQNYGAQLPDALRMFAERIPLLDARFFVTAVLTQREAGGNLAEVLDRLASVMRERFKIRREVRTRSAHGRMTAYVLAGMPPTLALFLMMSSPAHLKIMIDDPLGVRMIVVAVLMQLLGTFIVRKIVAVQY